MNHLLLDQPHLVERLETALEREVYKKSYYEFYKVAFAQLHPGQEYSDNWHAKYLCDVLQAEAERIIRKEKRTKDIVVNVPFRSSKSMICTVIFPVWCWTLDPSMKFISVSFSGSLAIEHSSRSMDLINSPWFQKLWGRQVELKPGQQAKGHYETTATGMRKAVGTGGQITGSGADILIIDDPQDPQMATSETERLNTKNFYDHTLFSRLNDPDVGFRLIVMQRLHEDDLTGHLLNKKTGRPEDHRHICIPGELDMEILSPKSLEKYYTNGLFWAQRFHKAALLAYEKTLGSVQYAGQIGQRPAPKEGNLVKRSWFAIKQAEMISRDPNACPIKFFLDTAYTEKQENDPSAILAAFLLKDTVYIMNTAEGYFEFPKLISFVQSYVALNDYSAYGSMIWVEPKASGKSLVQSLRTNSKLNIGEIESELVNGKDKIGRLTTITPYLQSGRVVLIEGAWNDAFLTQVCSFPNAAHDEFVDLLSYCVDTLLINNQGDLMGTM